MTTVTAPLVLRISVTDRCPLRCVYCPSARGGECARPVIACAADDIVRFVRVAQTAAGVAKVRLTGGEPLGRSDIVNLVAALAPLGVPDLGADHQRPAPGAARPVLAPGRTPPCQRQFSIPSTRKPSGASAQGGVLAPSLAGIDAALAAGLAPVRINTVSCAGVNDHEAEALVARALERGCGATLHRADALGPAPSGLPGLVHAVRRLLASVWPHLRFQPIAHEPASSSRRFTVTTRGRQARHGRLSSLRIANPFVSAAAACVSPQMVACSLPWPRRPHRHSRPASRPLIASSRRAHRRRPARRPCMQTPPSGPFCIPIPHVLGRWVNDRSRFEE